MKIVRFNLLRFVPASHENTQNPGVFKKILFKKLDLVEGRIQMINWSRMPVGKSFEAHYHEDMQEVFIILSGRVRVKVGDEEEILEKGDAVLIPIQAVHEMWNLGEVEVDYIALGIATSDKGKTVNV